MREAVFVERQFVKGLFLFVLVAWPSFLPANGDDCNANGVDDELDLASGTSADCDANGVPDECDLAPTLDFPSAQHLAAGLRPLAVLSADLNGDDRPDLVALSSEEEVGTNGDHAVSWLLNRGDREFETARRIFVSSDPASPVAEDLDADGDLDLALIHKRYNCCSDDAPNFTILTNDGSGNLDIHDARRIANATATLCAGDFDSDGRMDLAVGPTSALRIDILRNEGDLEFSQESFTIEMPPAILKSGDIDGDSILDLVVAYEGRGGDSGVAALLLGDGAAGFSLSRRVGAGAEPMGMILEDLDRDSDLDIAVACAGSWEVVVSSNPGTGIFVWPSRMDMGGRAVALASADMDLDGDPDIVVGEQGSPVLIFLENSGTGTFPGRFDHVVNGYPYTVDLSDLDGDGDPDVSTPYVDGNAVAITWNGHGRLESARSQRIGGAGPGAIEAGDFDGDGLIDIVIVTANSVTRNFGFLVMASAGDGTFEGPVFHNNLTPIGEVAVIEATGDGRPDLITTNQEDGSISLFINEGGTFTRKAMSTFPGYKPFFVRPIDLDGDVHPDLALLDASESQQATVGLLFSSGDGTFRRGRSFQTGPYPGSLACGDFDGDGDGDVAVTGVLSRSLWVSRNTGDAVFELDTELRTGERPLSMGVGDLDGDGRLDLCIGNTDSSDVSLFFQEAAGGLRAGPRIPVGERPRAFAIADLDRDGNTDVLVANEHSNSVSILLGDGDGSFTRDEELEVDRQPVALFAGDIDGDEHLDICAVGQAAGRITILRKMLLPPPSADCDSNGVPDECDVAAGGDLDSNGILDSCELPRFRRGDPNDDGTANISDSLRIFGFLFIGDQTLHCKDAGDANDDGSLDITDGIFLLEFLFGSGRPVPPPGHLDCGVDPGPPAGNPLGCDRYERC